MKFKEWLSLNEGVFGNFNYIVPNDKKQQLYDFYMLEKLLSKNGLISRSIEKAKKNDISPTLVGNISQAGGNQDWSHEEEIDNALMDVAGKLIPYLRDAILHAVYFSIASELRHSIPPTIKKYPLDNDYDRGDEDTSSKLYTDPRAKIQNPNLTTGFKNYYNDISRFKNIEKYRYRKPDKYDNTLEKFKNKLEPYQPLHPDIHHGDYPREIAYKISRKNFNNPVDFIKSAKQIFNAKSWEDQYGGQAWANICDAWLRLNNAIPKPNNRYQDTIMAIDHMYDIQHNSGTVFDKVDSYNAHAWMKDSLTHKANTSTPWQLYDQVSSPMKKIAAFAIKEKYGTSLESHKNNLKKINDEYNHIINSANGHTVDEFVGPLLSLKYPWVDVIKVIPTYDQSAFLDKVNYLKDTKELINNCIDKIKIDEGKIFYYKYLEKIWEKITKIFGTGPRSFLNFNSNLDEFKPMLDCFGPNAFKYIQMAQNEFYKHFKGASTPKEIEARKKVI